jgi:hypothetical protein
MDAHAELALRTHSSKRRDTVIAELEAEGFTGTPDTARWAQAIFTQSSSRSSADAD